MFYRNETMGDLLVSSVLVPRATLKEAKEFKEMLLNVFYTKRKNIIVDLSECEYIDSTFIGVLVYMMRKFISSGGDLKLVNLKNTQNTIFEWTRLNRIFEIFTSRQEAFESFYKVFAKAV